MLLEFGSLVMTWPELILLLGGLRNIHIYYDIYCLN